MSKILPGVFINQHGAIVPDDVAEAAGFDIDAARSERDRIAALTKARNEINATFRETAAQQMVVENRGGYELRDAGFGRVMLHGPDGEKLTPKPVTKEEGEKYLSAVAGDAEATS